VILSVTSSLPTFKALQFRRGLNVLLADRASTSTEGQTRNSAGKSSLVEIIHFLLGADVDKKGLFQVPEFLPHSFSAVLRLKSVVVRVTRHCSAPERILMDDRRAMRLGLKTSADETTGEQFVTVDEWKDFLGQTWFGLPSRRVGTAFEKPRSPTFRMLFGYFARRSRDHGFQHVDRYAERQQEADAQIALSYLLGLDWTIPRDIRASKDEATKMSKLKQLLTKGELGFMFGKSAEIRPELARAEERVAQLERREERFSVHDSYKELATEAAALHAEASRLTLDLAKAQDELRYLRQTAAEETPPSYASVETLYEAVGIELPGLARRRFEDVQRFQASVIENRRAFLQEQIQEAAEEVRRLEEAMEMARLRRASILDELRGKGAMEELTDLQRDLAESRARRDGLAEKLRTATTVEANAAKRKKDSAEYEMRLQADYEAHEAEIGVATRLVDRAIGALYNDRQGNLLISPTRNGPTFTVTIGGGGNMGGIDQMKVFCFDMMLFDRVTERLGGPRFLVHDSHLFDGVDLRQAQSALLLGHEVAGRAAGQYLVLMNSDKFEKLEAVTTLQQAVLPIQLTDTDSGGLFGFRFELPSQRR
jgi:uncharacterized protein YydD (DUF2326 family)